VQAKNARSTIGQVADQAGVSMHVARQAVFVVHHAPDLAEEVQRGQLAQTSL
jgi:hypothetical protein